MFERVYFSRSSTISLPASPESGIHRIEADLPLDRKIKLLLAQRWNDAGEEAPLLTPRELRAIARVVWDLADIASGTDPRCLAHCYELKCRAAAVHGCYGEQTDGLMILYRLRGGEREWGFRVLHGIAHWALRKRPHNEADVWLLTIALAVQAEELRQVGVDAFIIENPYTPTWLIRLCAERLGLLLTRRLRRFRRLRSRTCMRRQPERGSGPSLQGSPGPFRGPTEHCIPPKGAKAACQRK